MVTAMLSARSALSSSSRMFRRRLATSVNPVPEKDCRTITPPYAKLTDNLAKVKRILDGRPLTLAEKILYSHLTNPEETVPVRGETYLKLSPGL